MFLGGKSPRFSHLPLFDLHCWAVSEMTVRTPFGGTNLGNPSHRRGQHFLNQEWAFKAGQHRAGLETGKTIGLDV